MSSPGDQPATKRQKTFNADGPVENDETARQKLREAGFDPNDVHTARSDLENEELRYWYNITPMTHFAFYGDLPMCRYLHHIRGASTKTATEEHRAEPNKDVPWFPINAASSNNRFQIFKWLCLNGAISETLKTDVFGESSLEVISPIDNIFSREERKTRLDLVKWLILEGVLEDDIGNTDRGRLCTFLHYLTHDYAGWVQSIFLDWLKEMLAANDAFHAFLLGTVRNPPYSIAEMKRVLGRRIGSAEAASMLVDTAVKDGSDRDIWDQLIVDSGRTTSSNSCLASFDGVLEKIGDYVGIIKEGKKIARIKTAQEIARNITTEDLSILHDDSESDSDY